MLFRKVKNKKQKKQECKRFEINVVHVVSIKKSLTEYPH